MHTLQALPAFFIGTIGPMEWAIIIGLALLIFGGKRVGEIGKGLGEGIRNFRTAVSAKDEKPAEGQKEAPKTS